MPQQADEILNRLLSMGLIREDVPPVRSSEGSVNTVWRVAVTPAGEAVLRIGPDRATVGAGPSWLRFGALACEAIVLDRIRAVVPEAPLTLAAGFRSRPWLLQEAVPGAPLATVLAGLTRAERERAWRQVGSLLRRLHGVAGPWFGTPDGRQRYRTWPAMVRADAEGLLADATRYGLDPEPFRRLLAEIDSAGDALAAVTRPAVVHSDLDPRHIFVGQGERGCEISGVIDWEYARYVDPHSESLLVAMLARPGSDPDRAALLAGYGLDPATLEDPRYWARQAIYRGLAEGWAVTDAARVRPADVVNVEQPSLE